MDGVIDRASLDVITFMFGDSKFREYLSNRNFPNDEMGQVLQEMYVVSVNNCIYVAAREFVNIYMAVIFYQPAIFRRFTKG